MPKEQNKDPKLQDLKKTKLDADKAEQIKGGKASQPSIHFK